MKLLNKIQALCFLSVLLVLSNIAVNSETQPLAAQIKKQKSDNNVLKDMLDGNKKFIKGALTKQDVKSQREETSKGQHPHTIVVTCSDSRVPPEYIFDEGIGQLFVVRTAGNVVDDICLGSIEYAAEHLHAKQIIVMGHTSCGAVKATLEGETESPNINAIIKLIKPAVKTAKSKNLKEKEVLSESITENVKNQIKAIMKSKIIRELTEINRMSVCGAVYDINSGKVEILK